MRAFLTKTQLIDILETAHREEHIHHGSWETCAVGNVLNAIADGRGGSRPMVNSFGYKFQSGNNAIQADLGITGHGDLRDAKRFIKEEHYLSALSVLFEGGENCSGPPWRTFIAQVRELFPARMMIDVGGIVPAIAYRRKAPSGATPRCKKS